MRQQEELSQQRNSCVLRQLGKPAANEDTPSFPILIEQKSWDDAHYYS